MDGWLGGQKKNRWIKNGWLDGLIGKIDGWLEGRIPNMKI